MKRFTKHVGGVVYYIGAIVITAISYVYIGVVSGIFIISEAASTLFGYEPGELEMSQFMATLPVFKDSADHIDFLKK